MSVALVIFSSVEIYTKIATNLRDCFDVFGTDDPESVFRIAKSVNTNIIITERIKLLSVGISFVSRLLQNFPAFSIILMSNLVKKPTSNNQLKKSGLKGIIPDLSDKIKAKEILDDYLLNQSKIQFENYFNYLFNKKITFTKYDTDSIFSSCCDLPLPEKELQHDRFYRSNLPILFTGESGTGKTFAARKAHLCSDRRSNPFVAVNCAAIPESIAESEFFGTVNGAYTGSVNRMGLFESANTGTIFLDEIGDMPMGIQSKLLKIIEDGTFTRVGSNRICKTDVRIICATNIDLSEKIKLGLFRQDLYFRISVVPLTIYPLRTRKNEVPTLVNDYLKPKNKMMTIKAMKKILDYSWPGNIRELFSCLARAVVLAKENVISENEINF